MTTNAQRFYTTNQQASGLPGTVFDFDDTNSITSALTKNTYSGTGTTTIRLEPFGTTTTTGTITAATNHGWRMRAVADVASTASAKRITPSGTWSFAMSCSSSAALGQAAVITAVVHRVSSGGTVTELFRAASASTTVGAAGAATAVTWTSASQAQYILEASETLQIEYWCASTGLVVTGGAQTITFNQSSLWSVDLPTPGLRTLNLATVDTVGSGVVSAPEKIILTAKTFTAIGVATLTRRLTLGRTVNPTATGSTTINKLITRPLVFTATGLTGITKLDTKRVTTTAVAVISAPEKIILTAKLFTATGVATVARQLTAFRVITAVATGNSFFARALIFGRRITATAAGVVKIRADLPIERIPSGSGGTGIVTTPPAVVLVDGEPAKNLAGILYTQT